MLILLKKLKKRHKNWQNHMRRRYTTLYAFLGGVGVIMFWYGLWEGLAYVPILGHPVVAMVVGLAIMSVMGLVVFEMIGDYEGVKVADDDTNVDYAVVRDEIAQEYEVSEESFS